MLKPLNVMQGPSSVRKFCILKKNIESLHFNIFFGKIRYTDYCFKYCDENISSHPMTMY